MSVRVGVAAPVAVVVRAALVLAAQADLRAAATDKPDNAIAIEELVFVWEKHVKSVICYVSSAEGIIKSPRFRIKQVVVFADPHALVGGHIGDHKPHVIRTQAHHHEIPHGRIQQEY